MSDDGKKFTAAHDDPLSVAANRDPNKKEWVKFEEESDDVVTPKDIKVRLFKCRLKVIH